MENNDPIVQKAWRNIALAYVQHNKARQHRHDHSRSAQHAQKAAAFMATAATHVRQMDAPTYDRTIQPLISNFPPALARFLEVSQAPALRGGEDAKLKLDDEPLSNPWILGDDGSSEAAFGQDQADGSTKQELPMDAFLAHQESIVDTLCTELNTIRESFAFQDINNEDQYNKYNTAKQRLKEVKRWITAYVTPDKFDPPQEYDNTVLDALNAVVAKLEAKTTEIDQQWDDNKETKTSKATAQARLDFTSQILTKNLQAQTEGYVPNWAPTYLQSPYGKEEVYHKVWTSLGLDSYGEKSLFNHVQSMFSEYTAWCEKKNIDAKSIEDSMSLTKVLEMVNEVTAQISDLTTKKAAVEKIEQEAVQTYKTLESQLKKCDETLKTLTETANNGRQLYLLADKVNMTLLNDHYSTETDNGTQDINLNYYLSDFDEANEAIGTSVPSWKEACESNPSIKPKLQSWLQWYKKQLNNDDNPFLKDIKVDPIAIDSYEQKLDWKKSTEQLMAPYDMWKEEQTEKVNKIRKLLDETEKSMEMTFLNGEEVNTYQTEMQYFIEDGIGGVRIIGRIFNRPYRENQNRPMEKQKVLPCLYQDTQDPTFIKFDTTKDFTITEKESILTDNVGDKKADDVFGPFYKVLAPTYKKSGDKIQVEQVHNQAMWEEIEPSLKRLDEGRSVVCVSYGYSGSGKTYGFFNDEGDTKDKGVVYRFLDSLPEKAKVGLCVRELYGESEDMELAYMTSMTGEIWEYVHTDDVGKKATWRGTNPVDDILYVKEIDPGKKFDFELSGHEPVVTKVNQLNLCDPAWYLEYPSGFVTDVQEEVRKSEWVVGKVYQNGNGGPAGCYVKSDGYSYLEEFCIVEDPTDLTIKDDEDRTINFDTADMYNMKSSSPKYQVFIHLTLLGTSWWLTRDQFTYSIQQGNIGNIYESIAANIEKIKNSMDPVSSANTILETLGFSTLKFKENYTGNKQNNSIRVFLSPYLAQKDTGNEHVNRWVISENGVKDSRGTDGNVMFEVYNNKTKTIHYVINDKKGKQWQIVRAVYDASGKTVRGLLMVCRHKISDSKEKLQRFLTPVERALSTEGKFYNINRTKFHDIYENINDKRIALGHIRPTPNNPESSRGHLFLTFQVTYENGKKGRFCVCDLAGSENPLDICEQMMQSKNNEALNWKDEFRDHLVLQVNGRQVIPPSLEKYKPKSFTIDNKTITPKVEDAYKIARQGIFINESNHHLMAYLRAQDMSVQSCNLECGSIDLGNRHVLVDVSKDFDTVQVNEVQKVNQYDGKKLYEYDVDYNQLKDIPYGVSTIQMTSGEAVVLAKLAEKVKDVQDDEEYNYENNGTNYLISKTVKYASWFNVFADSKYATTSNVYVHGPEVFVKLGKDTIKRNIHENVQACRILRPRESVPKPGWIHP